jgi:hypothetical protein
MVKLFSNCGKWSKSMQTEGKQALQRAQGLLFSSRISL